MRYISVAEAANRWGVSQRSVRGYCADGKISGAFLSGKNQYVYSMKNIKKIEGYPLSYWLSSELLNLFSNSTVSSNFICRAGMQTGNNEVFISFLTDKYNQVIENGIVDIEMAENIKQEIIANNYNMTDYQIFDI